MGGLLVSWLLSAISLLIVAHFVPGFMVEGFVAALIAAIVIGLINATIGLFLKIVTIPLSIVTFGIFLLVINEYVFDLTKRNNCLSREYLHHDLILKSILQHYPRNNGRG